jgi:hypothetical protein
MTPVKLGQTGGTPAAGSPAVSSGATGTPA